MELESESYSLPSCQGLVYEDKHLPLVVSDGWKKANFCESNHASAPNTNKNTKVPAMRTAAEANPFKDEYDASRGSWHASKELQHISQFSHWKGSSESVGSPPEIAFKKIV